jgi:hypothetical protein
MCQRLLNPGVNGAEPVNGYAHHALRLFALPGVRTWASRHAEDPVWLLIVIAHRFVPVTVLPWPGPDPG